MATIPLSVLILTHRDDERLAKTLASVSFADEVKVIKLADPINNFSNLKNYYASQLKHNWVLFLDSDEVVSTSLANEITQVINHDQIAGYYVRRQDYFTGRLLHYGEVGNVWLLRLVQKKFATWERPVHEVLTVTRMTKKLNQPLQHYPHDSVSEFFQKIVFYSGLEAKYRFDQHKVFSLMELLFFPMLKFIMNYIVKLGFLDGCPGLIYAVMMSLHSFIVRVRLYELNHANND